MVLKQRLQHSLLGFRFDLLLVNHLVDHLLRDAGKCLLFTVENSHTCVHGASELDEALEGEVGDAGGRPHPGLRVEALLAPRPSARLLPVGLLLLVLHWLLQLHALLKARRDTQTPADEDPFLLVCVFHCKVSLYVS